MYSTNGAFIYMFGYLGYLFYVYQETIKATKKYVVSYLLIKIYNINIFMQKSALISIRSFVIYITRISTYHASYYSNTPSHLNNFSCVDVNKMYNMIFNALEGNSFLFIGRGNQFRCALVCCNLLVKKNSPL